MASGLAAVRDMEPCLDGWLYFVQMGDSGPIKVGRAVYPLKRLAELQTGNPVPLRLLAASEGGGRLEAGVHRALWEGRIGETEWFEPMAVWDFFIEGGVADFVSMTLAD